MAVCKSGGGRWGILSFVLALRSSDCDQKHFRTEDEANCRLHEETVGKMSAEEGRWALDAAVTRNDEGFGGDLSICASSICPLWFDDSVG